MLSPKQDLAEQAVDIIKEDAEFYRTPEGLAYATVKFKNFSETMLLDSERFKNVLLAKFNHRTSGILRNQTVKDSIQFLKSLCQFDAQVVPLFLRYARYEDKIYIDLANENSELVEISKDGYRTIPSSESPVKFIRKNGMLPMPRPETGGSVKLMNDVMNINNKNAETLISAWIIGAMNPKGPYPMLLLEGEQGTAKSTTAKLIKDLIDPSTVPLLTLPKSERDLTISANSSWCLCYDNVSNLSPKLSDAFCRVLTGAGIRSRKLYTDSDEVLIRYKRPMIITSITDVVTQHDLADRSIAINLESIPKEKRQCEKVLLKKWWEIKPLVFGASCKVLSAALNNEDTLILNAAGRFADFSSWASGAESGFGWEPGTFIAEYNRNLMEMNENAIERDSVALAVTHFMKDRVNEKCYEIVHTPTEMLDFLTRYAHSYQRYLADWPKQAHILSKRLKQAAAVLRRRNIDIQWKKSGERKIIMRWIEDQAENKSEESENVIAPAN